MRMGKPKLLTLIIAILLATWVQFTDSAVLSNVGVESADRTVSAVTTLSLFSTLTTEVPSGGKFEIVVPPTTSIASGALSCTMTEPTTITVSCTGNTSTRTITVNISTVIPAGTFFQIDVSGFTNPDSSKATSTFEFKTYNTAGTVLDEKTSGILLTAVAGTLSAATMTPSDSTVGATNTVTFSITTAHRITSGGSIQVSMPKWNPNAAAASQLSMIQGTCTCTAIQNLGASLSSTWVPGTDLLSITGAITSDIAASTVLRWSCSGFRNPISTAIKTGFTISTFSSDGGTVDSRSTTLKVDNPATITQGVLSNKGTKTVQELSIFQLTFPSPVPLDQGWLIDIVFPSTLPISTTDLINVRGVGLFGASKTMTTTIDTSTRTIQLTNGCTTYISPDFDALVEFTRIQNPMSTRPTDSISILIKDASGNSIATRTTGIQYVASFGAFTSGTMSASPTVISSIASAVISMLPVHSIPTTGALKITFPSSFVFSGTTCSLSNHLNIVTSAGCSISGRVIRISSPFTSLYSPSWTGTCNIGFTVNYITMPATTAPTGSFSYESVLVDGSDYVIDKSSYTNMITATSGTIVSATVAPAVSVANQLTTYTFTFQVSHTIVRDAKIQVTFPSSITMPTPSTSANSCKAISGIEASLICVATSSTLTINSGYSASSQPAGTIVSFSLTQVLNPVSLEATSSFTIKTLSEDDYEIDVVTTGVTVTMSSVNDISSVLLTPQSLVNGAKTNLNINLVSSSPLVNGDILLVTFPSQVTAPSGTITCTGITALSTTLSCRAKSASVIEVTLSFTTSLVAANELLVFSINQYTNPTTTEPTSSFDFLITNSNGFNINDYSGTSRVTTAEAAQLVSPSITPSNKIALTDVDIDFTFTLAHDLPSAGVIYIFYPSTVGYNSAKLACNCLNLSTGSTTSTCTCEQQTVSAETRIIFRNAFTSGLSAGSQVRISLSGLINPQNAVATNSFKIFTETAETSGYRIDKTETGLTILVDWNYPCLTWPSGTSTCASCITSIDAYKLQENTWVLTCNEDKFFNSTTNTCEDCAPSCASCSTTDKAICTKWGLTNFEFLHSGTCIPTCPSTFFGNSVTFTWDSWDVATAHCLNWETSATKCTSCDKTSSFPYYLDNTCLQKCPSDEYVQDSTAFSCTKCDANCKTCTGSPTQWVTCNSNMKLDLRDNSCVASCETDKTIINGDTWVGCDSNCLTWAGSTTTCTSCSSGNVLTTGFKWASSWSNSNETVVNNKCETWDPTCATCTGTTTFCTSCAENFALHENKCISDCPLKYEDQDRVWVLVGLVWPTNYEPNEEQTACVPTIKTCQGDKILNEDQTKCIPPPGQVVPFPLLWVAFIFILVVIAGKIKDKTRSKIIGNLIPLFGLLETPGLFILIIVLALVESWILMGVSIVVFLLSILHNVIMFILFRKYTCKDEDYIFFAKRYPKTSDTLSFLWVMWNFRVLKFFYSGFFGLDTCFLTLSKSEQSFMKYFRRVIISWFIFVHLPAYLVCLAGIASISWGYQALVECIEVPVILFTILVLTILERRCEKSRIEQDSYLPIAANKFAEDINVMSAIPLHRSMTKDRLGDEESKTENYSISVEADRQYQKELDYDVELRKKALMSIVDHIKNPERRGSIFDTDRSLGNCTFFEETKYESSQRRENPKPLRRAFSFGGLNPIDEEEEFLLSEEDSDSDYKDRRFDKGPPKIQRRGSFPMRVDELKQVENPIFSEAMDEYRATLMKPLDDNCYADSKPPKPIIIEVPPVMADMGCQTMLRDMLFDEDSDEEFERVDYEEAELESDFAGNLIEGVIDNLSESSIYKEKKKVEADRLKDVPEFELEDILGEFDVDDNGNFIIKNENGELVDNNGHRVNQKGYLIDKDSNIINKQGQIIFYAEEVGEDGEIPAPFVYEKHKNDFLSKALQRKEGITIDPNYMIDDDEDLVEAELKKLRPDSAHSSVESLVAENPGLYVEENLTKGMKSIQNSPGNVDSQQVDQNNLRKGSPNRNSITKHDKDLARSYGGKAKGSMKNSFKGQPKRITREDTAEMFPSLAVENQAKDKLNKIVDKMGNGQPEKFEKNEELRKQLAKLKEEHFRDLDSDDLGDLNMDLIEQKIDDFDFNRQKEYEERMRKHIQSNMHPFNSNAQNHTSSNFYPNGTPFQNSDLLPPRDNSRVTTSKAQYNSRMDVRPKTRHTSGLQKIYGNLGELVVPAEHREHDQLSRIYSPGSTVTIRSGLSRQQTNKTKFDNNPRMKGLEQIYLQKLENRKKNNPKSSQGSRKAKFRTLHNKYIDDPSIQASP